MYVTTLFNSLLGLLALTSATVAKPLASAGTDASPAEKRNIAMGVYICTVQNWSGACNYQAEVNLGACYQRSLTPIASFGPDHGLTCTLYDGPNCGRDGAVMRVPGIAWPGLNPIRDGLIQNGWNTAYQNVESWSCDNGGD